MSSFQPKRPSSTGQPSVKPTPSALPAARPNPSGTMGRLGSVRDASAEAHAIGGGAVARPSAIAGPAGRRSVLLVDPDANLRARLRSLLEMHYDVVEAKDGMEVVELASTMLTPSLIVSETTMPRVDGFTMAKIIRENPVLKRVPIMFVSAQHSPQHVTQALVIGVTQYLPKTTPLQQIVDKIRKLVP